MSENNYYNIIDFGSSKIRFSVFDNKLKEKFSESKITIFNNDNLSYFSEIKNIVKKAEKEISSHIEDIILILDSKRLLNINISLFKNIDYKSSIIKLYDTLILELRQLIYSHYQSYEIVHTIIDKCIIDDIEYSELPIKKKDVSNIKIDFKLICFPKKNIDELKTNFSKINLNIISFYCSSFVKSSSYIKKLNLNKISFLEIGYERTSLLIYDYNKIKFIQTVPIGSSHITKDISKIFKITYNDAEKIKKSFNKSETEFSYTGKSNNNDISVKDIINKKISIDLLKKVILYRIQEIIDLHFKLSRIKNYNINLKETDLFLIGEGSILFDNNSFYLDNKFEFKSINYLSETDSQICLSGIAQYLSEYEKPKINIKNKGLFEKFFFYFSK